MRVPFSYLQEQFKDYQVYLDKISEVVTAGDYTLGQAVTEFEARFAALLGAKYAVGVNSGTDALFLSLKAIGVGPGDEVITSPNTFIATVGAIVASGARPVFVDCNDEYVINADLIEPAITSRTRAIIPVHYAGVAADMDRIMTVAQRHGLPVIEDACQAILGAVNGKCAGTFGVTGAFSLHPLKNLNVWGDSGVIITDSEEIRDRLRLLRNHGLSNRDEVACFGYNSRLDTIQAAVGNHLIAGDPLDHGNPDKMGPKVRPGPVPALRLHHGAPETEPQTLRPPPLHGAGPRPGQIARLSPKQRHRGQGALSHSGASPEVLRPFRL